MSTPRGQRRTAQRVSSSMANPKRDLRLRPTSTLGPAVSVVLAIWRVETRPLDSDGAASGH